jgi:hypothetical protein
MYGEKEGSPDVEDVLYGNIVLYVNEDKSRSLHRCR